MRKKLNFLLITVAAIILLMQCSVFAVKPTVTDKAGFLTPQDLSRISERLENIRQTYNFDVAVYIDDVMTGKDAESTADDLFDYGGYGMGKDKDGIILYISRSPRKFHYSTHGSGEKIFNGSAYRLLDDRVLTNLKNNRYAAALNAYADTTEELLEFYKTNGKPYNKKSGMTILITIAIVVLVPLIIALIATKSKLKKMNTAVDNDYADSYMKPGSLKVTGSNDLFLYSVVTRTEKPKNESGSHTSSSGQSHGGHGGSY